MIVVTAGSTYLDIDAYAGCVAYAELLNLQGQSAIAASSARLNESINKAIRSWKTNFSSSYMPSKDDKFVLIDLSDPANFDKIVNFEQIIGVIDHHGGFEDYWQKRLGPAANIKQIGAASTIVYEYWLASRRLAEISKISAALLASAILDNTLNLGAHITTQIDKDAYAKLRTLANLPDEWPSVYFRQCQQSIMDNPGNAVGNDYKVIKYKCFDRPVCVGQLTVWDGDLVTKKCYDVLRSELLKIKPDWLVNIIGIKQQKSYFLTDITDLQKSFSNLLNIGFNGAISIADRVWLRKEIAKQDLTYQSKD